MLSEPGNAELGKGFSDPVLGAQRCFRSILTAMSEPGLRQSLSEAIEPPPGLTPAAAMLLLTLADHETPVWLAPHWRGAASFVRFHCGAPVVEAPHLARFALLDGASAEPAIAAFDGGDDRYPDRSATLFVQCSALDGGEPVVLSGPGIRTNRQIRPAGLHAGFWHEAQANSERYPLGVDLILAAGDAILAVPRSTRIALSREIC
jgi:alpha-D-ribose 1-methylphosphonate 5-triphosphate synthase subunit PhnH